MLYPLNVLITVHCMYRVHPLAILCALWLAVQLLGLCGVSPHACTYIQALLFCVYVVPTTTDLCPAATSVHIRTLTLPLTSATKGMPLRHQARRLHSSPCVRVLGGRCATLAGLWHFNWVCLIFEVVCGVIPYPYTHCLMACINAHNVCVWGGVGGVGVVVGACACMWVWVSSGCVALQHCNTHSYILCHDWDGLACCTCAMCRESCLEVCMW